MRTKQPHRTDIVVGRNIKLRRTAKRMSQTELGDKIGITFQQVQKYENGVNRVGASRLMQIAESLEVPINAFFEGAGAGADEAESYADSPLQLISDRQALRLAQAFAGIASVRVRRSIVKLVEEIAGQGPSSDDSGDGR